ncbi:MAG: hypothetical protein KY476_08930 [Planctomycetes bacterium]|nr:hypothetical protein [Planctomycetota bacterium]
MKRSAFAAIVVVLLPTVFAEPARAQTLPQAERQLRCPVIPSELVSFTGPTLRYRGVKIRFSSRPAALKWMRSPESYLDLAILPQLKSLTLPERPLEQVWCPVYRDRKVSERDPWLLHEGRKIYFYDATARERWQIDTAKYLNLDLLPQLPRPAPPAGGENAGNGDEAPPEN